jgi:hypothetical protein
MQKVIDYIKSKSITDTSMAVAHKMIMENVDRQEDCILLLFQSMYETNQKLIQEVLRTRAKSPVVIAP